ncbi:MAG TPA: hypothetical protein VGR67_07050 [Candidatus Polarisedimenticolia bacterium]|jgi:hypothetical protein|nr:hypothetical protein [Candidatus Polarisedimenticolia bacterium]
MKKLPITLKTLPFALPSLLGIVALALLFPTTGALAASHANTEVEEVGKQPVQVDFPSGGNLKMDLCSSGVEIIGVDKNRVLVSYDGPKDNSRVKVSLKTSGSEGTVEVDGCTHDNFRITIEVPRQTHLHVRMAAGELRVEDITGNKDLELHAGELNVDLGRAGDYAHVEASVMTGEVEAAAFDVSKGGFFRSFERKGPGRYRLHAHVGLGQVTIN